MTNSTLIDNPSMGIYHAKLTDADTAIASVVSGSSVAIGMAAGQPPALLRALAARAERGEIDRVKLFYFHAEAPMSQTVLRYEAERGRTDLEIMDYREYPWGQKILVDNMIREKYKC